MEDPALTLNSRLQQEVALMTLTRLKYSNLIPAVLALIIFVVTVAHAASLEAMNWGLAIGALLVARVVLLRKNSGFQRGDNPVDGLKISRIALLFAISDGIIWSSANWVIFSNLLGNNYLISSLTIGAAATYGIIYLFQPRAAVTASLLAILPLLIFSYSKQGEAVYQLVAFVAVFCLVIWLGLLELKKLIFNYFTESFEHKLVAGKEREASFLLSENWKNTPLAAIEIDSRKTIRRWNPSAEKIFGYTAQEIVGQPVDCLFSAEDVQTIRKNWRHLRDGIQPERNVYVCRGKGGREVHTEWHDSVLVMDGQFVGISSLVEDVTSQVVSQQTIETQANFDELTGLPNRSQMIKKIDQVILQCQQGREHAALIFLDLDHFKDINDTQGHDAGDEVLKRFAASLSSVLRHNDMVARFGGDEFVVLLEELGTSTAEARRYTKSIEEKLIHCGEQLCERNGHKFDLDVSGGIALINNHTESSSQVLKEADLAMYQAKQNGRKGICYYDESLSLDAEYRVEVLRNIRHAMENNEFELFAQPIVTSDGELCYFENLIRWKRPGNKAYSAANFIDIVASSSMIIELGFWVIQQACQHINHLREQHLWADHYAFFINVSPKQLEEKDFADNLIATLNEYEIRPEWLVIELTEESVISRDAEVSAALNKLANYGVRIALDDFGTGYSSLALLKDLPVHFIKIDKTFINGILDKSHRQIIYAVIRLSEVMGLKVIAEGVENSRQLDLLARMRCDFIQGYHFHRPMPADMLEIVLARAGGELDNVLPFCKEPSSPEENTPLASPM